jgi:hypothetical protein
MTPIESAEINEQRILLNYSETMIWYSTIKGELKLILSNI